MAYHSHYVSHAVVRLELLDEQNNTLSWGSGFIVDEPDYLSLYTCWHVITGIDPHRFPAKTPRPRATLRTHVLGIETPAPGVTAIGGHETFELNLFDDKGIRTWDQGEPQAGFEDARIPPPNWDCVRFDVQKFRSRFPNVFKPNDIATNRLEIWHDAYLVGFPYGFSANEGGPEPIFLRRNLAGTSGPRFFDLLDGPGAKGMSGGPIVTRVENQWKLSGIYNGVVFPESKYFPEELEKENSKSSLPLGKFTSLTIARAVVGAQIDTNTK